MRCVKGIVTKADGSDDTNPAKRVDAKDEKEDEEVDGGKTHQGANSMYVVYACALECVWLLYLH